jgi:hypothetical protein
MCAWGTLCLLFWQGSWQLLYHPSSTIARTPASVGLAFDPVAFAVSDSGVPRLSGWWIPAAADGKYRQFTVLFLHGQTGNMSDAVSDLAELHGLGLNVLAFDYRGYGQSQFVHPSEAHWREDAGWALNYLAGTRHVPAETILVAGKDLGANLALEVGAAHAELGGVVLETPVASPVSAIFDDPRAGLVPAHLLVPDRYDSAVAAELKVPSLWIAQSSTVGKTGARGTPEAYEKAPSGKMLVWLKVGADRTDFEDSLGRWLDDLHATFGASGSL